MNKSQQQRNQYTIDPQILTGFKSIREKHKQFFQSLEHKLISKSNKLSNFMGITHVPNFTKAQSEHFDHDQDSFNDGHQRKHIQSSSVSPVKHRMDPVRISGYENKQIPKPPKPLALSSAMQKILKYKEDIIDKKNFSRSSTSSFENQRNLAYDLDFTIAQINLEEINDHAQKHNVKEIYEKTFEQKKKLTETISTTSSLKYRKNEYIQIQPMIQYKVTLSDFQIIKPLGEGKFGTVFLARHIKSNFLCGIKKMSKVFQDQSIIEQLIRQIKIQSFLDHPNICQLYTYFLEGQFIYLVLELCNSGNVYNVLKKANRFPEQKVKSIIRQVCHAIEYLHEHDIIHRDIKPQNIIFHQNVIKLCDFGWSVYAPLSRGTLCGTPIYASPQLVQQKQYDSKIDIWNIGILTYELLYGRVPFQIRCEDDLQKVVQEEIYFPKNVPISDDAKDFIRQCLNKNPKYRITIMKMLDHDFIYQKDQKDTHQIK